MTTTVVIVDKRVEGCHWLRTCTAGLQNNPLASVAGYVAGSGGQR